MCVCLFVSFNFFLGEGGVGLFFGGVGERERGGALTAKVISTNVILISASYIHILIVYYYNSTETALLFTKRHYILLLGMQFTSNTPFWLPSQSTTLYSTWLLRSRSFLLGSKMMLIEGVNHAASSRQARPKLVKSVKRRHFLILIAWAACLSVDFPYALSSLLPQLGHSLWDSDSGYADLILQEGHAPAQHGITPPLSPAISTISHKDYRSSLITLYVPPSLGRR